MSERRAFEYVVLPEQGNPDIRWAVPIDLIRVTLRQITRSLSNVVPSGLDGLWQPGSLLG